MRIDVWSDVVCPWCYIGKRNLEAALDRFEARDQVAVTWHSFELDPSAPRTREGDYATRLSRKYGVERAEAQTMIDRMTAAAAGVGLDFRFDLSRPGNTFDAHRLIHLGATHGIQDEVKERFLKATFTEGAPIGEPETLAQLAVDAGLDPQEVAEVLGGDRYAEAVRADEAEAAELGITAVPFFVIDGKYGLPGAQPPELLLRVIERMRAKRERTITILSDGDGEGDATACEGDSCAV